MRLLQHSTCLISGTCLALLICVGGCKPVSPPLPTPSVTLTDRERAPVHEAMVRRVGEWVVDLDQTMQFNASVSKEVLDFIKQDLTEHPFELLITNDQYVSRSKELTRRDRYKVLHVGSEVVTIELSSAEKEMVEYQSKRSAQLMLRDGFLIINPYRVPAIVMRRLPVQTWLP